MNWRRDRTLNLVLDRVFGRMSNSTAPKVSTTIVIRLVGSAAWLDRIKEPMLEQLAEDMYGNS